VSHLTDALSLLPEGALQDPHPYTQSLRRWGPVATIAHVGACPSLLQRQWPSAALEAGWCTLLLAEVLV